jgi:hypothetical protein
MYDKNLFVSDFDHKVIYTCKSIVNAQIVLPKPL